MAGGVGAAAYLIGTVGLIAALGALIWGATSLRATALAGWTGARARLAETVITLAVGLGVAQVIGAVGLLRAPVVGAAEVLAGLGLVGVARATDRRRATRSSGRTVVVSVVAAGREPGVGRSKWEWVMPSAALSVVVVQWVSHTLDALGRGMSHPDTLWYHLPFVARFIQAGGYPELGGVGYEAARWFPFDAQLLQALAILPYDRDWLVPLLNLGWMALALLAAWCIGERRGAGPVAVAAAAVVIGLPVMAATQPGQASTDIACAALLLAAVALVLDSGLVPAPLVIAGAATGLAISTKVTLAFPVAALVTLVFLLSAVERRWRAAGGWLAAIALTGTFWFGRNWVQSGSPLPWFDVPLLFDRATVEQQADSLLGAGQFDRDTWNVIYRPGLQQALGRAWPAMLAVVVSGAALVVRGRTATERIAGIVVAAGVLGYLVTPLTAGLSFGFNVRYVGPTILLAATLVPLVLPASRAWRHGQCIAALVLVVAAATAEHVERTEAWPESTPVAFALIALGAALVVTVRVALRRNIVPAPALGVVALTAVVALGFLLQRYQADRRYLDAGIPPTDVIPTTFRNVRTARVGLFGSVETYPLFGIDLSNEVELGTEPPAGPGSICQRWRAHLGDRYDYVVLSTFGFAPSPSPPEGVLGDDPAATLVASDGIHVVYRLDGALDRAACPAS